MCLKSFFFDIRIAPDCNGMCSKKTDARRSTLETSPAAKRLHSEKLVHRAEANSNHSRLWDSPDFKTVSSHYFEIVYEDFNFSNNLCGVR